MAKKASGRVKVEAAAYPVPQTREEVVNAISAIGAAQRERDRIRTAMNEALAELKEEYEAAARPFAEQIKELSQGVQTWCEAHRAELTRDGRVKTHQFASGEVRWRMRPPSVVVRGSVAVLDALKSLGLARFIRTKEEVNREAILAEPDAVAGVKGVTVSQKEDFVVVPWDTELEEVV